MAQGVTARLRGLAAGAVLLLFLVPAVPATLARAKLFFGRGREQMHVSPLEAHGRLLGRSYIYGLDAIRRQIPTDEAYFLVDGGEEEERAPLWVRYELAPRKALLLGSLDSLPPRALRLVRRLPLPWVVIAYPPGTPARAVRREEFLEEVAGRRERLEP